MTSCHDPYRELELYLQKAQVEIGIAVKELEDQETVDDKREKLILPPREFRSQEEFTSTKFSDFKSSACSNENHCNSENLSKTPISSHSTRPSFFSSIKTDKFLENGKPLYPPSVRKKLWRMQPSFSFPETSKDLLMLGQEISKDKYSMCSDTNSHHSTKSSSSEAHELKYRQRSKSDTCAPYFSHSIPEAFYPSPPIGDVNLLSIWADNLVLDLDKSLMKELNSFESYSTSSDSLSPNKPDVINYDDAHLSFDSTNKSSSFSFESICLSNRIKEKSISPDSGIEQTSCETSIGNSVDSVVEPEKRTIHLYIPDSLMSEDCVDSVRVSKPKFMNVNCEDPRESFDKLENDKNGTESFRDFEVKDGCPLVHKRKNNSSSRTEPHSFHFVDQGSVPNGIKTDRSQATQTDKPFCSKQSHFKKVASIFKTDDRCELVGTVKNSVPYHAHALTTENNVNEESFVVRTINVVNDARSDSNHHGNYDYTPQNKLANDSASIPERIFFSLPITQRSFPKYRGKYSSLTNKRKEFSEKVFPQRSVTQSTIPSIGCSGIDELAEFVRQVKRRGTNQPFRADVSTDMKEDKEMKDVITQTSPLTLSPSSSFTSVTDCDCSDSDGKNLISASDDDSTTFFQCKNEHTFAFKSSFSVSSDDDDDGRASPSSHSSSSSLYLSACSGSSDSFEEAIITELPVYTDVSKNFFAFNNRCSETTLRGSMLGDISEEQGTTDTICNESTSNPSIDNCLNHPASFPSTLKLSRKNRLAGGPSQPIEPEVLITNNMKSVSAPVLLRQKRNILLSQSSSSDSSPPPESRDKDALNQVPLRAHSAKELNELQAIEACSWLRAAGFPQYAQMYEDNQFPIDVSIVQKDHTFLHPDSIQSLFRRLNTLNRCAKMKFKDHVNRASIHIEESDEEEQYALSENWEFQHSNRRWSRIPSASDGIAEFASNDPPAPIKPPENNPKDKFLNPDELCGSSHDSVFVEEQYSSLDSVRRSNALKNDKISAPIAHFGDYSPGSSSGSGGTLSLASEDMQQERRSIRRSGSDRVRDGARAILKRMESLKGKRKKKMSESSIPEAPAVSGTDGSSSSSLASSPQFLRSQKQGAVSPETLRKFTGKEDDLSLHSDTECRLFLVADSWKDTNSNDTKNLQQFISSKTSVTVTSPQEESNCISFHDTVKNDDSLSFNATKKFLHPNYSNIEEAKDCDKRGSYYDNVCAPLVVFNEYYSKNLDENESNSSARSGKIYSSEKSLQSQDDEDIIIMDNERRDSGVGSSLTRGITYQQAPWHCFPFSSETKSFRGPLLITDLTAPQILLLRKLSLLKLTTIMEKFSPSSRTGWSWGVSKFIGRIRNPDYKDKVVFGVPLLLILQRTGQPLPVSIQAAIHHLRTTALDSTGLFRKSGVRSRIQKLKNLNETVPEKICYEEQQAYDVADMLKQYFRELPEALLTNKLSETFVSIFQFVPEDLRLEAIHSAIMLMPDENREVLQSLLEFLHEVCQHSGVNQMNATNIAVCFAPSLFHLSSPRSSSSSPRRRKTVGVPDLRELDENKAAYECLSCMISHYESLFTVSEEVVSQSRLSSASFSQPISVEEVCSFVSSDGQPGWRGYIDSCIQVFLKEAKEKYKGWKTISQNDRIELASKKVNDGHPLKLWKVSTEVEAPPVELLNRILRERHLWDSSYIKGKVVSRLSKQSEVIQYQSSSLPPHPPCDFCVLRSWKNDLPKGTCILVETSVEHPDAEVPPGSVTGLILSSRYLIEPCGSGKSRITHISRVDTRGRSPEWYNRAYGHICTLLLVKLRNSFARCRADGPETKV